MRWKSGWTRRLARFLGDEGGQAMTEYIVILLALITLNELSGVVTGLRVLSFPDWENSYVGRGILTLYAGIIRVASSPVP